MTKQEILEHIKGNPWEIIHYDVDDEELQLAAIEENPFSIRVIPNPTEKVQLKAVEDMQSAFIYIRKPFPSVISLVDQEYYKVPRNITPNSKYAFYEPVYSTMEQIMFHFDCYINEKVKFFKYKTLKSAMNYLFKQKNWHFENGSRACLIDIRKIKDNFKVDYNDIEMLEYLNHKENNEFSHGLEIDMNYVLPLLCGVEFCLDGHGDYIVFEYENELYIITVLCYE